MKKPGLFAIEAVIAVGALILILGLGILYRGAIADKFGQLFGRNSTISTSKPTPTAPLITPLPTSTFPAPGATAEPGSIAVIKPSSTPTPVTAAPLPGAGPADMFIVIAIIGGALAGGYYLHARHVA